MKITKLSQDQIKEIAEELDMGMACFWNRETNELVFFPDTVQFYELDIEEAFADEVAKVENNRDKFVQIEKYSSNYGFEIMAEFAESLNDRNQLKTMIINALNRSKPFRNFKHIIETSNLREDWFAFKHQKLMVWVKSHIQQIENLEG